MAPFSLSSSINESIHGASAKMSKKVQDGGTKKRKIGKRTTRSMLSWSHYRFRSFLLHKAKEYPSCRVVICDEAYTSKTCGKCGHWEEARRLCVHLRNAVIELTGM